MSKPPLGVMPEWRWKELNPTPSQAALELRFLSVKGAIRRAFESGTPILDSWVKEIKKLHEIVGDVDVKQQP
jgi:hypothetical protein